MLRIMLWFIIFFITHFVFGMKGNNFNIMNLSMVIIFSLFMTFATYKLIIVFNKKKLFLLVLVPFLLGISLFSLLSIQDYVAFNIFPWDTIDGILVTEDGKTTIQDN